MQSRKLLTHGHSDGNLGRLGEVVVRLLRCMAAALIRGTERVAVSTVFTVVAAGSRTIRMHLVFQYALLPLAPKESPEEKHQARGLGHRRN